MYNNAGSKVKGLATVMATIGMILSVLIGFLAMVAGIMSGGSVSAVLGSLITIGLGCLGSWLGGLTLAAFGELVENTGEILDILKNGPKANLQAANYEYGAVDLSNEEASVKVTSQEIEAVMRRDGIPYVEATLRAKKEKAAAMKQGAAPMANASAAPAPQIPAAPVKQYEAPKPAYTAPVQQYEAPKPAYTAPVQQYEAPKPAYTAPVQQYETPKASYNLPAQQPRPAANVCRACGKPLSPGAVFCGSCGTRQKT